MVCAGTVCLMKGNMANYPGWMRWHFNSRRERTHQCLGSFENESGGMDMVVNFMDLRSHASLREVYVSDTSIRTGHTSVTRHQLTCSKARLMVDLKVDDQHLYGWE